MTENEKKMVRQAAGFDIETPKSAKPISFVMDGEGVKKVTKNEIGTFVEKVNEIPLDVVDESFEWTLPKIPLELLLQIELWFKAHTSEIMAQIFWNRDEKKYFIYIPEQEVSGASVHAKRNEELEKRHLLVLDIHSHNTMGAFFSGTDDADERGCRIFGVIGEIDSADGSMLKLRAGRKNVALKAVFEYPDFPREEWDKKIIQQTFAEKYPNYGKTWRYGVQSDADKYRDAHMKDVHKIGVGADDSDFDWAMSFLQNLDKKELRIMSKTIKKMLKCGKQGKLFNEFSCEYE